jgi:toxin FitB
VSRYLLDTNIISNVTKPEPSASLIAWMAEQLEQWCSGPEGPQALFAGRVLSFDEKAALIWARIMAEGKATGRPRSPLDMILAAIGEANGCIVVTDNEKHFAGLKFLNPMSAAR